MTPYYQDKWATIYAGDNMEVLPLIESVSIDLTVTSPPYDNLRKYQGYSFDFEGVAKELYRVTKPGGVVVWVVADETIDGSETLTSFRQALYFRGLGFNVETMIYEIAGTGAKGSNNYYWQAFEYMFVLSKGMPKTHNLITDVRATNPGKVVWAGRKDENGQTKTRERVMNEYSTRTNVWRMASGYNQHNTTGHPAPFPEALANDHIRSWSNPGDLILDPFCGSGTTAKMARKNGCKFIGIDVSREYCEISRRRLAQEVLEFSA